MKNKLLSTLTLGLALTSGFAQALEVEVAPLRPEIKVEVLGVKAHANGESAVILTGKAALTAAKILDLAIDTSVDMLVFTGSEVADLLNRTIKSPLNGVEYTLISTQKFSHETFKLIKNFHKAELVVVSCATNTAGTGIEFVSELLFDLPSKTLVLIYDAGMVILNGVNLGIGFGLTVSCKILGMVGLNLGCK